jgi:hypothetical protein
VWTVSSSSNRGEFSPPDLAPAAPALRRGKQQGVAQRASAPGRASGWGQKAETGAVAGHGTCCNERAPPCGTGAETRDASDVVAPQCCKQGADTRQNSAPPQAPVAKLQQQKLFSGTLATAALPCHCVAQPGSSTAATAGRRSFRYGPTHLAPRCAHSRGWRPSRSPRPAPATSLPIREFHSSVATRGRGGTSLPTPRRRPASPPPPCLAAAALPRHHHHCRHHQQSPGLHGHSADYVPGQAAAGGASAPPLWNPATTSPARLPPSAATCASTTHQTLGFSRPLLRHHARLPCTPCPARGSISPPHLNLARQRRAFSHP